MSQKALYSDCCYAECSYAECRSAYRRGLKYKNYDILNKLNADCNNLIRPISQKNILRCINEKPIGKKCFRNVFLSN